ncbi:MAG: COG4280 domain-containing protein [Chloroflexia bacterium]
MPVHAWIGFISSFLASSVEVVEAVTLVLAAGVTRGWRSTWIGVATGLLALAALVIVFGVSLQSVIPLNVLRIVIGTLLLIFGLQWLRKAIMRYTGLQELHDEARIYTREVSALETAVKTGPGMDWTAFTVSFKGVLLEGLEVVFIVITFGLSAGDMTPALAGAVVAAVVVIVVAFAVHAPLSRVPENTLKFVVGIMLSAFGTFWAGEGVGLKWPGEDLAILGLLIFYALVAGALIMAFRPSAAGGKAVRQV